MRFAIWASLLIVPCSITACAAESAEHDRHVKELDARVRQLATRCERLEERLLAVETVETHRASTSASGATRSSNASGSRPELPTVKAGPDSPPIETSGEPERVADANADESSRLVIVGEGTRVETRVAGEAHAAPVTNAGKPNSRAAKRNPSTVPSTAPSGVNP